MRAGAIAYPGKINDIYMREKQYEMHINKLNAIRNEKSHIVVKSPQKQVVIDNVKEIKNRRLKYNEQMKISSIQKDNNRLLTKLIQISQRSNTAYVVKRHDIDDPLLHHKNFYARKREALHIQSENERIANRIMQQDATVKKKKLDQEFNQQRKLMSRLSKHEWQNKAVLKVRQNIMSQMYNNKEMSIMFPPVDNHEMRNSSFNHTRNNMSMTPDIHSQRNQSQTAIQPPLNNTQKNVRTKKSYSYHNGRAINISGVHKTEETQNHSIENSQQQLTSSTFHNPKSSQQPYKKQNSSNNTKLNNSYQQNRNSKTPERLQSNESFAKDQDNDKQKSAKFGSHDKSLSMYHSSQFQQKDSKDVEQQYSQKFESPSKSIQEQNSVQVSPQKASQ
ncbi:hypothetical protein TTHERM_00775950 (macronuclear) [Tetrahymena thermophila SB210]|uniref:Uncharacterized protein n=1 Tax=Tetrahymena thermophila (strain SB210) TaxID=312017 RepID=Q23WW1_TETTS|nr:hypothetical protein TTHERM_00775950 [Tetrahymena thermophila SB210]EAS00984.2 hypothetical protein TTHERM_00775950 [Tetrahymena thermophila SB210]|eukprot:XP_001021229.2 hypothetical protein TTHERM_00775950 [Tetrahymena thermophila SB210]